MAKFFEGLKMGLEEALAHAEGKITLRSMIIEVPAPPTKYKFKDIKKIREKGRYSEAIFARILNVSPRTIQAWESGHRAPSQSALRLLEIIDKGIYPHEMYSKH